MTTTDKPKPRLKNLDDLFELNGGVNPIEQSVQSLETQPISTHTVTSIAIHSLTPFKGHPFRLYEGERLDDMVASIEANGVLVPIIVRKVDSILEILAGHNRVNAAKLAGHQEVPAIILENVSDADAMVCVVETNLIQRAFTDMTHSEKAAIIALHHSKMFSQGKRNDILEQIRTLENPHEYRKNGTSSQVGTKLRTDEKIGETYALSRNTIARYIRVQKLIPSLKSKLDDGSIPFIPAVTISFLNENEQQRLNKCIELDGFVVDIKKADMLRQYSEKGKLDDDTLYLILSGEIGQNPKPNRTPIVKVSRVVYAKYFQSGQSEKEIQSIVETALDFYFSHQV